MRLVRRVAGFFFYTMHRTLVLPSIILARKARPRSMYRGDWSAHDAQTVVVETMVVVVLRKKKKKAVVKVKGVRKLWVIRLHYGVDDKVTCHVSVVRRALIHKHIVVGVGGERSPHPGTKQRPPLTPPRHVSLSRSVQLVVRCFKGASHRATF